MDIEQYAATINKQEALANARAKAARRRRIMANAEHKRTGKGGTK